MDARKAIELTIELHTVPLLLHPTVIYLLHNVAIKMHIIETVDRNTYTTYF